MKQDLKIKWGTVIHCPTEELANKVSAIFESLGYTWSSEDSYKNNNLWGVYREETCYRPHLGSFCKKDFYIKNNIAIIEAEHFLKLHTSYKMESRNITLTLEKAKEFYNSGNDALKEVALQAFTKEELTIPEWQNIKTFEDACKALGLNMDFVNFALCNMKNIEGGLGDYLTAFYKMGIIRKALNGNWKPSLVKGKVYYPFVEFYLANKVKEATNSNGWKLGPFGPSFMADGEKYTLVDGGYYCWGAPGVGNFLEGDGHVNANVGLLGCKSEEIAQHMSRYFMKEIFEAVYTQHIGMYEWIDEV